MRKFSNECQAYDALSDPHSFKGGDTQPDLIAGWQVREMLKPGSTPESMSKIMAKKIEIEVKAMPDKLGIIVKQSEVWVWNDQVFASYEAAKKARIQDGLFEKLYLSTYPNSSKATIASAVKQMKTNNSSYAFYPHQITAVFTQLLDELDT